MADKEQEKPDFAPKEYKLPNFDFSDTEVGKKAAAEAATKTHTVESGESLWAIAEAELGAGKRWKEIYELNKGVIGDNPDLIKPGQELKLPS
jgi:nucleoid-associated protein YgaU